MYALNEIQPLSAAQDLATPLSNRCRSLSRHIPRRSVCHIRAVSFDDSGRPASLENSLLAQGRRQPRNDRPWVGVSAYPTSDRSCRHHVFIEHGTWLKKLDLPSTARVAVSQQFEARVGDTLSFNYVALLYADSGFAADRSGVRVILVNLAVATADSLLDRSIDSCGAAKDGRVTSRLRESRLFTIPTSGKYELRFVTAVDPENRGSEAHLLVNSVCVLDPAGNEVKRLASLSCVGKVR